MDATNLKSKKRILQELQNLDSSLHFHKKIKLNHDEIELKQENSSLKQCREFVTKQFNHVYINLHPEADSIIEKLTDEYFVKCFNLNKFMVRCLLMELHQRTFYHPDLDDIEGIPFDLSVLVALSYLVHGHLECVANLDYFVDCSSYSLKKCVKRICQIIVYFLTPEYVSFPNTLREQQKNKAGFLQQFGVPGVVGVIDCFHVGLSEIQPHEVYMYLNRRFQQSLSVQVICDQNLRFLDINPRFSGYTHNIFIWKHSHIRHILEHSRENDPKTWLVADRGYHLSPVLVNPYRNAIHKQQKDVNKALNEVHEVVLKSFSILKARFRCLYTSLPFNHVHAANVITSCATLHNYLIAKHQAIDNQLSYELPVQKKLPNARHEDQYSQIAKENREFIKDFIFNNSL